MFLSRFLDGFEGADYFPLFLRCLVCAQPTDKQFVFRADRAGGANIVIKN